MSTEKEDSRALPERFDARLLSLYSRGVQDGMPKVHGSTDLSHSFCYYDIIETQKVEIVDRPILRDAYMLMQKGRHSGQKLGLGFSRSIVAVMDVSDQADSGYTRKNIDDFWSQGQEFPLFFVSMLNLADRHDMDITLKGIKDNFQGMPHLAYITFDHCDIILFCRGDSFQEYARRIFKLYYTGEKGLEDAITLYSFTGGRRLPETEEHFAALVRVGIKDYPSRELFYKKLEKFEKDNKYAPLHKYWLLERNDIGFYREDATLSWLMQARQAVLDVEQEHEMPWYTTYSLTVLIPDGTDEERGIWRGYDRPREDQIAAKLQEHMNGLYTKFKRKYENAHSSLREGNIQVYGDLVLLRWIEESYRLVASLMSSRLSEDMGICLFPQFMDMLEYGIRFFSQVNISQIELEHIQESFGTFFSNIAVLVDSMNQTDRQFVQVPAFHLPSFEIPPQIMAYYTIVVQKMLTALKDEDEDVFCGITISPKLVTTLSVFSLGSQEVLPNDEWISMNMDEKSFYTLRLTTETLAHEVSHYAGRRLRNRDIRKGCMIKCVFQTLLSELISRFAQRVDALAEQAYGELPGAIRPGLDVGLLSRAANVLWEQAQELDPEMYLADRYHYSWHMRAVIQQIPQDIKNDLALGHSVIDQIWQAITEAHENGNEGCGILLERLRGYVQWKLGLQGDSLNGGAAETLNVIARNEAEDILITIIDELMEELRYISDQPSSKLAGLTGLRLSYQCDMFRETFADLQAILLLGMKWEDYCGLLLQEKKEPGKDHAPRMFAVTKALLSCGAWEKSSIHNGDTFANVRDALDLDPVDDADILAQKHRISPVLSFYLIEYLTQCAKDIYECFREKRHELVEELQTIHDDISDHASFLKLQEMIFGLKEKYWQSLLQ